MNSFKKGHTILEKDISILRTEKILEVGVHPIFLDNFIGKKITKDIKSGEAVNWSCIIEK